MKVTMDESHNLGDQYEDPEIPEQMPINEPISRLEDMSPRGRLTLIRQEDGDICIAIVDDDGAMAGVEFCTPMIGGGASPKVLAALNELGLAIIADNKEHPSRKWPR